MAMTDTQVDAVFAADVKANGCVWLEGEVWPFQRCGGSVLGGKHYCQEHYNRAYVKNSALRNKRKAKFIEAEVREAELAALIADQEADVDVVDVAEPLTVDFG